MTRACTRSGGPSSSGPCSPFPLRTTSARRVCGVEGPGGQGGRAVWEACAGPRGPGQAQNSETSCLPPSKVPGSLAPLH